MHRRACVSAACLIAMSWLAPHSAAAQPGPATGATQPTEDDARARELFRAGEAAFDEGRFDDALDSFERAYGLSRRPALLFNIGVAAQMARKRERALEAYRQYLRLLPDANNRAVVETRIADLEELLARPDSASPAPSAPPSSAGPEPDAAVPDSSDGSTLGGWIVVGVSAVAAVTGAVLLGLAMLDRDTVEDPAAGARWSELESARDRVPVLSTVGFALLGAGVVGVGVGSVLVVSGSW